MKITSQPLTFLDTTDSRKLEVYISSNHPTIQLYDVNDKTYTPDWSKTNLKLSADIFLDSAEIKPEKMLWYRQYINETTETLVSNGTYTEEVTVNSNMAQAVVTYICRVEYQGLTAFSKITFVRTDTGLNGSDGKDGTSVRILGTATAVTSVSNTDYYTITYSNSAVVAAELGDAYLYNGNLYVCAVKRDTDDYFINVGNIQGPPGTNGTDAKLVTLSSSSQVFKVSNTGTVTPTTITVTATAINTSVSAWTYSTDGGKTFTTTVPAGLSRNGNTITVTGSTLGVNSVVIKASDGTYGDTLTVHKVTDGANGSKGDSALMAFLTNENVSFAANSSGQVPTTSLTTNVVAYNGTEKVMPTVGTPSGMPSGMTISVDSASLAGSSKEVMLTISISNNSTLGSTSSNHGTITIPVTSPVSTNLILSWSKINAGQTGVGISSTTVTYGVSDTSSTQPTEWQNTIPTVAEGKYLWTRTVIDYTDASKEDTVTYTYSKQGSTGEKGSPGSSVTVSSIQYQEGSSATTAPTGTWQNAVVAVAEGNYLWTKTTFSDGKIAYGVTKQGVSGAPGRPGSDAVTFQVYSSNGYALSINTPTVTLQTFAYVGDVAITADATYQWYIYNDTGWTALSGETNAYLIITREDVAFSKSYMCAMTFDGVEYTSVATIDDKNDENKVFTTKPSNYAAGDIWIVGVDYAPSGVEIGTLLRAEHTNTAYEDADWVSATKYDDKINELQENITTYNQYFSFDSTEGLKISAKDDNGTPSQFSTSLTNERLSFNYGNEAIAYINGTKMNIKEAEIESPLTVTGKYSGSTMLQAPVINIGNFSIIVESNGSLSFVTNT